MIYSKTGVPWQMKSTLTIYLKLLEIPDFSFILRTFLDFFKSYSFLETVAKVANYGNLRPSVVVNW